MSNRFKAVGKVGHMVYDLRYPEPVIPMDGLEPIICPGCKALLARADLADATTIEFKCRRCEMKYTIRT